MRSGAGPLLAALTLATGVSGCRGPSPAPATAADELFARRQFAAAAEAWEEELAVAGASGGTDRVLFYLGLSYSFPELGADGARRARGYLERLIEAYPDSSYRPSAEILLALQRQRQTLFDQIRQLRETGATLERQLEELKKIDLEKGGQRPPPGG